MRNSIVSLLLGLTTWSICIHSADAAELSEPEARSILTAEVQRGALADYKGVYLDFYAGSQMFGRDFYSYSAQNIGSELTDTIGYFAVNKRTGAIWDLLGCKPVRAKLESPVVKRIRNSLGRSAFLKLYKERPTCFNG